MLVAVTAVTAKFRDFDGTSTYVDLSGPLAVGATGGVGAAASRYGHFRTTPGHALTLNLNSAVATGGHLTYVLE